MKKNILIIMLLISGFILNFILFSASAASEDEKINPDVYKSLEKNNEVRVVVDIKEPNPEQGFIIKTEKSQAKIEKEKQEIKEDVKDIVGKDDVKHEFEDSVAVAVSLEDLKKLEKNPDIEKVRIDMPIKAFLQDSVPLINATLVWPLIVSGINLTGINETVCIIDTGINFTHPDLVGKNKTGCLIDCIGKACVESCSIRDDNGHGTHVAGIVAAFGGKNGVAIGANLIGVKVLNSAGQGSGTDLDAAIGWCINNSVRYNISVISMSLGTDCVESPQYCYDYYCDNEVDVESTALLINNATLLNISVIIASGNNGNTAKISSPACIHNATAVGATDKSDAIASYSNRNNMTDLFAPGTSITSLNSIGGYRSDSGTSMATPHVAGAFAIMRQAFKLLNNRIPTSLEIQNILNSTGKQIYDSSTGLTFSRINVYAAVLSVDNNSPNVSLISPSDNYVNSINNLTFTCNATDNLLLSNITIYLWNSTSVYYNYTSGNFTELNVFVENISQGNYKWNCLAYDAKGNFSFASSNFSFDIENVSISLLNPVNNFYTNQNQTDFNCSSRTASTFKLVNVTLYIWNSSNDIDYNETKTISGTTNSTSFQYNLSYEGNYSWNCQAYNNVSLSAFAVSNYSINYDITSPIISNISSSVTSSSAIIIWNTDENANSSINYGTATTLGSVLTNSSYLTNHSISISSLSSSTTYYYNTTSCDSAGNCITNGTYSFTTSAAGVVQQSSGGGGGGGGGVPSYNTYAPTSQQLSGGYTQELNKNDKIKFTFFDIKSVAHTLTINEIKQNYINITIQSNPISLILAIGQSARLNLTSSDYYDLYVKVDSIENNKAKLTIQIIHEEIPKPSLTGKVIETPMLKTQEDETNKKELEQDVDYLSGQIRKIENMVFMFVLISVIVFIIIMIKKNIHSKKIKETKNDYKEIFNKHVNSKNKIKRLT